MNNYIPLPFTELIQIVLAMIGSITHLILVMLETQNDNQQNILNLMMQFDSFRNILWDFHNFLLNMRPLFYEIHHNMSFMDPRIANLFHHILTESVNDPNTLLNSELFERHDEYIVPTIDALIHQRAYTIPQVFDFVDMYQVITDGRTELAQSQTIISRLTELSR